MFNLLRRTRQRKAHKNKNYDVSDDEEASKPRAPTTAFDRSTESTHSNGAECRYLFSKRESKARESKSHGSSTRESSSHESSTRESKSHESGAGPRRAVIEELEDFGSDNDEEKASVKLAKTAAANGHSAISWRSDNLLYINNMGSGDAATKARTTTAAAAVDDDEERNERNDRNAAATATAAVGVFALAAGHATGSQNEAAIANAKAKYESRQHAGDGQLIGQERQDGLIKRIGPTTIDGNAEQQLQIAGTVIDADDINTKRNNTTATTTNTNTQTETENRVIYRRQSKQSNEQKRLSRLSLGNFALLKDNTAGEESVNSSSNSNSNSNKKQRSTTLQRSREFLSDIFMARGRNHHQKQRNQQQQPPQQQQPQQQQQQPANDVIAIGEARVTTAETSAAHLETNSDPAATVSTNSYQMTMSNNSSTPKNRHNGAALQTQSGDKESDALQRERRSNSAGAVRQEQPLLAKESQQLARELRRAADVHRQRRAASAEFIQAANVELCTVAEEDQQQQQHQQQQQQQRQQQGDATLQRSSSSNSINNNIYNYNNYYINNSSDIDLNSMGQSSGKPNDCQQQQQSSAHSSRASTPREFRESIVRDTKPTQPQHDVPKITVVDCSFEQSPSQSPQAVPVEEIFYDFEQPQQQSEQQLHEHESNINIEELNEAHVETLEDEVFAVDIPTTIYQQANGMPRPWTRLTNVKLENVQEEEEEEPEEHVNGEPEPEDDELDEALGMECDEPERRTPNGSRQSASSERSALKSDSNLSSSYADSGIGNDLPQQPHQQQHAHAAPLPPPRSSSMLSQPLRMPFVRDANSTSTDYDYDGDGEELLLQCDELDDEQQHNYDERLVCIESISLPDVVVESTTATTTATTTAASAAATSTTSASTSGDATNGSNDGHLNINITNGAGGNSLGNVHFIPIHIEGSAGSGRSRSNSPKHRSLDDSCIGRNSIEIVEDGSVLNSAAPSPSQEAHELKKELKLQKARFTTQLEDAHRNVQSLEAKVGDMQVRIQNLEQELSLKQWNVDRLQGELTAAQKDDEFVRKKLKVLEDEKINLRHKYSDDEDEFRRKYDALQSQYNELTEKYKETQSLANGLQTQLANAKLEVENWRNEVNKIRVELDEQIRILKNALEYSEAERKICEDKWQKEFEMLRTHNREREETLMSDCEWQMRQMQRQCKDKMDKTNYERKQASAKAEELELELQSRRKEAESLRICQAQVKSLSGVVSEQERSIQTLMERIENLKGELEMANENLETQIEAVHKIKYQCDNAIYDKERQMIYRIDEVRNEAAAFWENKLYTEMTRLTNELESVFVDERRDALDKLQAEHIEELRALTNRYTANEEELRAEIDELTGNLELKKEDFLALRERSDNALLQTRMHLDRADREYQNAMCREEDRRVELEAKLKREFEEEKEEMEEKFRERLGQVKEEFAKELQLSTQDMAESHRKELESQKAKLQSEKDEALQALVERHRAKMAAAEERINDVELRHQRNLKDLKAAYDAEKAALDKRDISNANEIEQLHRKCRCLTNLFEEMRMRYERRDPRAEDLREISELRTRCDSQERDLFVLTDRLREMQIQMSELQQNGDGATLRKKPPSKTIPTSCDVIYEENEERESPEQDLQQQQQQDSSEGGSSERDDNEEEQLEQEPSDTESNHTIEINHKCNDRINEDDAHMISAV